MKKEIKDFYEQTKFDFSKDEELVRDFEWPTSWIKIYFKTYPRMDKFPLAKSEYPSRDIKTLINLRESRRDFADKKISDKDLSELLFHSAGIKNAEEQLLDKTRRAYPSAGARYPIEIYLISNNIQDLNKGLFHYSVKNNELERLLEKDLKEDSKEIFGKRNYMINPNFLILTSVISRGEVKYGMNAYRFSCIECGHIGQNFSLIAADKNLACCAIGGFDNDKLARLLDLTEDEIPLYAFAFGVPK
jgi:SagB-type dehydrogenase family enzyme